MDHYVDIRLRPDPEFPEYQLMDALYAKLHRRLAQDNRQDVGISFPTLNERSQKLGATLRLHGSAAVLNALLATPWLGGMVQMVDLAPVTPVPANARHRRVSRVQAKSSPERLRRRAMRRKQIDSEAAQALIPDSAAERLHLPFVEIASSSTGQRFRLFLRHEAVQAEPSSGSFNAYGLSRTGSIPWF